MANSSSGHSPTASQTYLSTRGGDYGLSFETVVMKGLASDGGLFLPEAIPEVADWAKWKDLSYAQLALEVLGLYISPEEIPTTDLKALIDRSYSTFRSEDITPLVHLQNNTYLLELFHGPSYSFKDCALQFLGNLFEYFLQKRNRGKQGNEKQHLTVVGATSGDTGSAAIYGLRGKENVSVFILHPQGRISRCQENQMTTVLDPNVHNLAIKGTFDDCQDIVKALFNDPDTNKTLRLGAINSINFARILAQIVYYFRAYFQLIDKHPGFKLGDKARIVVPTGNHGNILAGYFAKRMGLPVEKLIVATNENDILDRFWKTGRYEMQPVYGQQAEGGSTADGVKAHAEGCKETLSPAMDILVSSNFERLMWFLAKDHAAAASHDDRSAKAEAGRNVLAWFLALKATGGFGPVDQRILADGRQAFESDRVSDTETLATIRDCYQHSTYVADPHTAVGLTVTARSVERASDSSTAHISLATAHPAKFADAVTLALQHETGFDFEKTVLPSALKELETMEKRVVLLDNSWESVRDTVQKRVSEQLASEE